MFQLEHALDRKLRLRRFASGHSLAPIAPIYRIVFLRGHSTVLPGRDHERDRWTRFAPRRTGLPPERSRTRIRTEGREAGETISEYGPRRGGERRPRDQGGYAPDDDTGGTGPPAAAETRRGRGGDAYPWGKTTLSAEDARGSERDPRAELGQPSVEPRPAAGGCARKAGPVHNSIRGGEVSEQSTSFRGMHAQRPRPPPWRYSYLARCGA